MNESINRSPSSPSLKALSVAATVIMYAVLLMGALVTNTGSGQGCGEHWPLCKGTFMPEWDYAAIIEFSHRAVSGIAGIVVTAVAWWAWRALRGRPHVALLSAVSVGFLVLQAGLGAAAVLWPQPKWVLAAHFGISLICFSAVLLLTVIIFRNGRAEAESRPVSLQFQRWVWWVTLFCYGVVYLGALVRHLRASLACMGWPLCNGEVLPPLVGPVGASFAHRAGAGLLVLVVVRLALMSRRHATHRPELIKAANLALLLILAQVVSGAVMALGYFNLLTQMVHSAIVTAFWGVLSYLAMEVTPTGVSAPSAQAHHSLPTPSR